MDKGPVMFRGGRTKVQSCLEEVGKSIKPCFDPNGVLLPSYGEKPFNKKCYLIIMKCFDSLGRSYLVKMLFDHYGEKPFR